MNFTLYRLLLAGLCSSTVASPTGITRVLFHICWTVEVGVTRLCPMYLSGTTLTVAPLSICILTGKSVMFTSPYLMATTVYGMNSADSLNVWVHRVDSMHIFCHLNFYIWLWSGFVFNTSNNFTPSRTFWLQTCMSASTEETLNFITRVKGALYRIPILCRRYTFWSYHAGLTIADPPG